MAHCLLVIKFYQLMKLSLRTRLLHLMRSKLSWVSPSPYSFFWDLLTNSYHFQIQTVQKASHKSKFFQLRLNCGEKVSRFFAHYFSLIIFTSITEKIHKSFKKNPTFQSRFFKFISIFCFRGFSVFFSDNLFLEIFLFFSKH